MACDAWLLSPSVLPGSLHVERAVSVLYSFVARKHIFRGGGMPWRGDAMFCLSFMR